MELWFVDRNVEFVEACQQSFAEFDRVYVLEGNILEFAECAIVSPANSYGFMDGGIDRQYVNFFGEPIERKLQTAIQRGLGGFPHERLNQEAIAKRKEGYLPVGSAEIIETCHSRIPYLIAAPTMITPEVVSAENCFYATIAILIAASKHYDIITKIYCPGLGTGIGKVSPQIAAKEMSMAYRKWSNKVHYQM